MIKITLAAARINAGLKQREAAELIGVSRTTIQNWEMYKSSPDISQAEAISKIYKIPLENIIFSAKKSSLKRD